MAELEACLSALEAKLEDHVREITTALRALKLSQDGRLEMLESKVDRIAGVLETVAAQLVARQGADPLTSGQAQLVAVEPEGPLFWEDVTAEEEKEAHKHTTVHKGQPVGAVSTTEDIAEPSLGRRTFVLSHEPPTGTAKGGPDTPLTSVDLAGDGSFLVDLPPGRDWCHDSAFGNPSSGFGFTSASPGNNDQMNMEDSMAEDMVQASMEQASTPAVPSFSPHPVPPPQSSFVFGLTPPSTASPFNFGPQHNSVNARNPFRATNSLGGSFTVAAGGGDKSGQKIIKINRKGRKK